jgi:hypothetical protein
MTDLTEFSSRAGDTGDIGLLGVGGESIGLMGVDREPDNTEVMIDGADMRVAGFFLGGGLGASASSARHVFSGGSVNSKWTDKFRGSIKLSGRSFDEKRRASGKEGFPDSS